MEKSFDFGDLPLVGRAPVQERILAALDLARSGKGSTLLLTGERGSGKTHLSRFIRGEAERRGFQIATGRAYRAEAGVPYSLFSDAFLPFLRAQPPEALNVLTRGGAPELEYLFPGLARTPDASPRMSSESVSEFRTRVIWTFTELLREMSRRNPLLVVLEDLQWADPSSLEITHFLARQLAGYPTLLLLTRDDGVAADPELAEMERSLLGQGVAEAVPLPLLDRAEAGVLIEKAFGVGEEIAGEFTDRLHAWTQGNPYFLEQTLETLVRSGRLHRKGGTWVGWEVRKMELPPTVRDALTTRLTSLPEEARALAELAAILGTRAPFALLRALSPLEERELLKTLDLLVAQEILVEGLGEGGVVYDFNQTLVRETLLAEMGLARARLLHGKVARGLEEHFGPRAPEHATALAFHHLEAEAGDGSANALLYLTLAGQGALKSYGNPEAAKYLRAALRLLEGEEFGGNPPPELPASRLEILRDLARALTRLGKYEAAIPFWQAAVEEAERGGFTEEVGEFHRRIGIIRSFNGQPFEALREFDTVLSSPAGTISPTLAARARLRRGVALEELGRPKEATEELEGVLRAAIDLKDPGLLAQAHRALVLLNIWTGRGDRVHSHAEEALELSRSSGAQSVEFWTYWGLAVYEGLLGNTGPMGDLVGKAEKAAKEMRSPLLKLRSTELAIEQAAATGEWNRGIAMGEQACAVARALSQNTLLPRLLAWTSLIYLGKGEVELARPLVEEAWAVSGAGEKALLNIHGAIPAHIGMGHLALAEGRLDDAIQVARAGLAMADRVGYWIWAIHRLLPLLAEAYLWAGDLESAREIGERLRRDSTPIGHRLGLAWAQACEALVTWQEHKDPAEGARLLEEAARGLEVIPLIPDAARLRRLKAGRMADAGDRAGALEELGRGPEIFLRLGAEGELEKTRGVFRELDARPPRKAVAGEGVLSSREMEIAQLVEARKSNKAIAKELDISPRTVSTHLSNIYQKLGLGSRGELADFVRAGGLREG